jgi:hypothetical protein
MVAIGGISIMSDSALKQPRRMNRLSWFIMPALLLVALAGSAFAFLGAHAASPTNGAYTFRAITTSGPKTGLYLSGQLNVTVSGTSVVGGLCAYSVAPSHCVVLDLGNTPDGVHFTFTIHEIGSMPAVQVTGTFSPTLGSTGGFKGTFSFSSKHVAISSGRWEATRISSLPSASGVWNIYGLYTTGVKKGQTFHSVLTLVQGADNRLTGTYCPAHSACLKVVGGNHQGYLYFFVGTPTTLEFRGVFIASHRANGQFQVPGTGGTLVEFGYWLAH